MVIQSSLKISLCLFSVSLAIQDCSVTHAFPKIVCMYHNGCNESCPLIVNWKPPRNCRNSIDHYELEVMENCLNESSEMRNTTNGTKIVLQMCQMADCYVKVNGITKRGLRTNSHCARLSYDFQTIEGSIISMS